MHYGGHGPTGDSRNHVPSKFGPILRRIPLLRPGLGNHALSEIPGNFEEVDEVSYGHYGTFTVLLYSSQFIL